MKNSKSVYSESTFYAFFKSIFTPTLCPAFFKCVPSIFYNFFFCQHRAARFPGKVPVTKVDHPLDEKIPFVPDWVTIYIDFVQFWIRMLSFFLRRYKRKAYGPVRKFILSMGKLYVHAGEVYKRNLSTTKRPFYISRPRFFLIHLTDPHLMCVPSLHVMVVIFTYTMFVWIAKQLGEEENLKEQALEMKQGALAITAAILFVKQHSVNCIPAALYAMTCFDPELFPPKEAENFINLLYSPAPDKSTMPKRSRVHPAASPKIDISEEDQAQIKSHILTLYRKLIKERDILKPWYDPILNFLKKYE